MNHFRLMCCVAILFFGCTAQRSTNQTILNSITWEKLDEYTNLVGPIDGRLFKSALEHDKFIQESVCLIQRLKYLSVTNRIDSALASIDNEKIDKQPQLKKILINQSILDFFYFGDSDTQHLEYLDLLWFPAEYIGGKYDQLFLKQQYIYEYYILQSDQEATKTLRQIKDSDFKLLFGLDFALTVGDYRTLFISEYRLRDKPLYWHTIPYSLIAAYQMNIHYFIKHVENISNDFKSHYHYYELPFIVEEICLYRYSIGDQLPVNRQELGDDLVESNKFLKTLEELQQCNIRINCRDIESNITDRILKNCDISDYDQCNNILEEVIWRNVTMKMLQREPCTPILPHY